MLAIVKWMQTLPMPPEYVSFGLMFGAIALMKSYSVTPKRQSLQQQDTRQLVDDHGFSSSVFNFLGEHLAANLLIGGI